MPLVEEALQKTKLPPRDFYAALMDYGAYLKGKGVRLNSQSKHYTKQSKFKGSKRELRGAILRELLQGPKTKILIAKNLSRKVGEVVVELERLEKEGLLTQARGRYSLAE
jgi:A/G-specific adenine glycosylase